MTKQTFRQLLDTWRLNGPDDQPPRTWEELATLLAISAPHLRSLMSGRRNGTPWVVARVADRLGKSKAEVQAALDTTQAESEDP